MNFKFPFLKKGQAIISIFLYLNSYNNFMRNPRLFFKDEELVYHVMSRTALPGYVLNNNEKSFLLKLITQLSQVYFFDVLAFCIMGNHFHLMIRNRKEHHFSDEEILNRLYNYYPKFRKKPDYWRPVFQSEISF